MIFSEDMYAEDVNSVLAELHNFMVLLHEHGTSLSGSTIRDNGSALIELAIKYHFLKVHGIPSISSEQCSYLGKIENAATDYVAAFVTEYGDLGDSVDARFVGFSKSGAIFLVHGADEQGLIRIVYDENCEVFRDDGIDLSSEEKRLIYLALNFVDDALMNTIDTHLKNKQLDFAE